MKTVLAAVKRAYSKIQVLQAGTELTADEISDAISEMNVMMWEHDADGLGLGWSDVSSSSENLPVPDWAIGLVENGLALRMSTEFGVPVDPAVLGMYTSSLAVVEKMLVRIPILQYPDILPRGGGGIWSGDKFFYDKTEFAVEGKTQGFLRDAEDNLYNDSPNNNDGDQI